jgi:hypothetical protein
MHDDDLLNQAVPLQVIGNFVPSVTIGMAAAMGRAAMRDRPCDDPG